MWIKKKIVKKNKDYIWVYKIIENLVRYINKYIDEKCPLFTKKLWNFN